MLCISVIASLSDHPLKRQKHHICRANAEAVTVHQINARKRKKQRR